jgi:DNA (cytosine-5)-methyltransferase 1
MKQLRLELYPKYNRNDTQMNGPTTVELCAGAGGQALGYEQAGFEHVCLVEIDKHACATLRLNRPGWNVLETDIADLRGQDWKGVELLCGGLPCPPFSIAGKQLGKDDERNLFPHALRLIDEIRPQAVMIENVKGLLEASFSQFREEWDHDLAKLGYKTGWKLMNACDFGVPQLRPRVVIVAFRKSLAGRFEWPVAQAFPAGTVGEVLGDLMAENGWQHAREWAMGANTIAPTLVGGSHKHGGPDLGPTRSRKAWAELGVDGSGLANEAPSANFSGMPKLTVRMAARLQGFPDDWHFAGGKTQSYRQVGNAFPPPFAKAVAERIKACLISKRVVAKAG